MSKFKLIVKSSIIKWLDELSRKRYIADYKECIALHPELDEPAEGEIEWLEKWRKYDKKVSPLSYRIFSRYIGPDINILPMEICVNVIEPVLTPGSLASFYNDKNSFGLLYNKDEMPITYVRNIGGAYYDDEYRPIDGNIISHIDSHEVIIKPSTESSGRGVALFKKIENILQDKNGNILTKEYLDKEYRADFVIQERFVQSNYMAQFNPSSVNTIRIATYKEPTGKVRYLRGVVRIGGDGAIVDNAHAGGRFIGIDDNGRFDKYVCDNVGNRYSVHNNIDFSQGEYIVPNFEQVKAFAEKISLRFIHHRLLALDIMLDKNNQPKMLEVNIQGFGAWVFQFTSGSAFREYTDSIMNYCSKEISKHDIKLVRF